MRNPGRLVSLPTKRDRGQIGRVGLEKEPILRDEAEKIVASPLLECHDAAERDVPTGLERERSERMSAGVAMQYAADSGCARLVNYCTRIVLGVPGVNDYWTPRFGGERHLC